MVTNIPIGGDWTPSSFQLGLNDVQNTFVSLWNSPETIKKVGMLFPKNADDGTSDRDVCGLAMPAGAAGHDATVPRCFLPRASDHAAQISAFRGGGVDIAGGITHVDDAKTVMNQCAQQGVKPKAIRVAFLFSSRIEALGDLGDGISSKVWWTPAVPFKAALTDESAKTSSKRGRKKPAVRGRRRYGGAIWDVALDSLKRRSTHLTAPPIPML